jgi:hypothetical protein
MPLVYSVKAAELAFDLASMSDWVGDCNQPYKFSVASFQTQRKSKRGLAPLFCLSFDTQNELRTSLGALPLHPKSAPIAQLVRAVDS